MSTISPTSEAVNEVGPPGTAAGGGGRFSRLWRGPDDDPRWARPSLLALLAAAAVMYLWDLSASRWANSFYAAAAQAGTKSWKAMLFGSLDAGNSITVDKPPAALWAMAISGRIFGFHPWSMLLPQALMGVATCGVVYMAVKRVLTRSRGASLGAGAGLLAAAALAVTPVAVLMFKFNNPDALLTLLLTLAVYAVVRAQEDGSTRWLLLAGTLIGFAFLTKTLQAFLILPALTAVYLATGPGRFLRRLWQILAAGLAIVVSAGWWVAIVQLTPASSRPYVGGSQHNSFLELTFGYNGFGRLTGNEVGSVGGGAMRRFGDVGGQTTATGNQMIGGPVGPNGPEFGLRGGPGSQGLGWHRMFNDELGSQISWLLPAALALFAFGLWAAGRARRTDSARASLLAWGLSLLSTAAVFSYMKGIFHPYYTIVLAPLIAITVGIGGGLLWARRSEWVARIGLAAAVGVTAWWGFELLARTSEWNGWLRFAVAGVGAVAAVLLLVGPMVVGRPGGRAGSVEDGADVENGVGADFETDADPAAAAAAPTAGTSGKALRWVALTLGVGAALLGPAAYTVATTGTAHTGSIPSAGPAGARGPGGGIRIFTRGGPGGIQLGGPNAQSPGGGQNGQLPGGSQGTNNQPPGGSAQQGGGGPQNGGAFPSGPGGPGGSNSPGGNRLGSLLDASTPGAQIQALLKQDAAGYRWVAAAVGAQVAAGYQLATGDPVMAIGGFNGSDPAPTLAQFQAYAAQHKVHYYIAPGGGFGGPANGGADMGGEIGDWVSAHYTAQTVDGVTIYDLSAAPTS